LEGQKLHGGWHLVRMRRRPGEKRDNWLLIKQTDDDARTENEKDILEEMPLSVKTGRTLDEIAQHMRKTKGKTKSRAKSTARSKAASRRKAPSKRKIKRARRR